MSNSDISPVPLGALFPMWRGRGCESSSTGMPAASDQPDRYPPLVGGLVLNEDGEPIEVVAPFAGPSALAAWMERRGITHYRVLLAHLPGAVAPHGSADPT
ncbi:hypothetical protein Ga0074812_14023 [Parafrankia irregularis]|uniref:Uncharacterized protein n=1 Tax=Parafrankia irregularis TaxID=795642 RepID=A0A0S4QZ53_9ACTN|nr:hypothetical protein Ga0074812_14023 [Parafrankia irregularis]